MKTLITNANIVNEGKIFSGNVLIEDQLLSKISSQLITEKVDKTIDAKVHYLFPCCIADPLNFRDPG